MINFFVLIVLCLVGIYLDKLNVFEFKCVNCFKGMFKNKEDGVVCIICLNGMFILIDGIEFVLGCIGIKVNFKLNFWNYFLGVNKIEF